MAKAMRKVRVGAVVRTGMEKTAVVEAVWKQRHRLYRKQMRRVARYRVHDPLNQCQVGDLVRIEETRPISKTKHWRILEIMQRRQVADVRPDELEADAEIPVADSPEELEAGQPEDSIEDAAAPTQEAEPDEEIESEPDDPVSDIPAPDEPADADEASADKAGDETGEKETQE
ncbi:MAG: 30S ribosomal protein S17 [SAR202 cluster bacterium Io17-Chloro-G9]|nr:MAG: 30S ribosomal protein S17 [SAR202 cluster bacterium Io17-Chloro-G9]